MKIKNILLDANNNAVTIDTLRKNNQGDSVTGIPVVYAHVDIVNDNGLKLNADSLEVTREKYPVLVEHSDSRVEDVVAYITTDGVPNDNGEFVGTIYFYDTPQGQHAKQLWLDGVFTELSVSYYIKEYDVIDNLDDTEYINVKKALLKEVSIVSVGADRDTHELVEKDEQVEEPEEELEDDVTGEDETVGDESGSNNELDAVKLNFYKNLIDK